MKVMGIAKLKKAVMAQAKIKNESCILVVDTLDQTIIRKVPADYDISKYDRFRYMFYYIGRGVPTC